MDNHKIVLDYQNNADVEGYEFQTGTAGIPLVTRVHAYDANDAAAITFCAEIPFCDGINSKMIKQKLELPEDTKFVDHFSFSVQKLDKATQYLGNSTGHRTQQISLKPQWNFYNLPSGNHWISSNVTCKTMVIDSNGKEVLFNHGKQNVCFHGSGEYNTAVSCDTHHLGFTGEDNKSRVILYHTSFSIGKGSESAIALNGQSKTGVILLYSKQDFETWTAQAIKGKTFPDALKNSPLIIDNERLSEIFGI